MLEGSFGTNVSLHERELMGCNSSVPEPFYGICIAEVLVEGKDGHRAICFRTNVPFVAQRENLSSDFRDILCSPSRGREGHFFATLAVTHAYHGTILTSFSSPGGTKERRLV
jgi:hypothetical protein